MKGTLIVVLATMAAVLLNGCGTICNLVSRDPEVYGGIKNDIEFTQTPHHEPLEVGAQWFVVVVLADMSLCMVADTLTLPVAIYLRQNERSSPAGTVPADGERVLPVRPGAIDVLLGGPSGQTPATPDAPQAASNLSEAPRQP